MTADRYLRYSSPFGGQISQLKDSLLNVGYYIPDCNTIDLKMTYEGVGGSTLLVFIVCVNQNTLLVCLRGAASINTIIPNCGDYSFTGACLQCEDGYHMVDTTCQANIGGCISYLDNICLVCNYF